MQRQQNTFHIPPDDAALFDRYGEIIFAYVRMHPIPNEDAEDITLEVFLAAYERANLSALNTVEQLAWLKRVARNKIVDHYRRIHRRPTIALDQFDEAIVDEDTGPDELVVQKETHGELHTYVKQLSPFQQQLLYLRYGAGLHCTEIAVLVNKRESAVRQLLSRTIRRLRSLYQQHGPHEEGV